MTELMLMRHGRDRLQPRAAFPGPCRCAAEQHRPAAGRSSGGPPRRRADRLRCEPATCSAPATRRRPCWRCARCQTGRPQLARAGLRHPRRLGRGRGAAAASGAVERLVTPRCRHRATRRRELPGRSTRVCWPPLQALAAAHSGARIAVFTHGGVLDMVWRELHGLPLAGPRECEIPNTGFNRLRWDGRMSSGWGDAALAGRHRRSRSRCREPCADGSGRGVTRSNRVSQPAHGRGRRRTFPRRLQRCTHGRSLGPAEQAAAQGRRPDADRAGRRLASAGRQG